MTQPDDQPLLPDTTSDERETGWGDEARDDDDQRLLDERPPHHDRE